MRPDIVDPESCTMIMCSCSTEGMSIRLFPEDDDPFAYVSIYEMYGRASWTMGQRIRTAFRVLSKGDVYGDQLVLNLNSLKVFRDKIDEAISVLEERERKSEEMRKSD